MKPLRKRPSLAGRRLPRLGGLVGGLDISMTDDNAIPRPIEDSMVSSLDVPTTK